MDIYYVYVLQDKNTESLYIGFTKNLRRRLNEHSSGNATTTKNKSYSLIYFEGYLNKADALGREKFLKGGSGRKYLNKQLAHYMAENVRIH